MIRPKLTRTEAILLPIITPAQHSVYEYFKISDYSLIFNVVAIIFIVMFVSFLYYNRRKNSKNKNT